MSDCATQKVRFETPTPLALEAAFDGGRLTSDGGLLWLSEMDEELGLCERISGCVKEWRNRRGRHSLCSLVRQRVFQIACGYEDQNDSDTLREDPLLKMVCGSLPESGADLASQPTISRMDTIALITNEHLKEMAIDLLEEAREEHQLTAKKATLFGEDLYAAASWEHARRVIYKAEAMQRGTNRRFVVSSRTDGPKELYEFYAKRGESENWIKDFKLRLKADRLSCHRFVANQFRLLLHACAYWLKDALWRKLIEGGCRRMQLDTLRVRLIKIGGRVRELLTKIRLHLASGHPGQDLWHALSGAFGVVHE